MVINRDIIKNRQKKIFFNYKTLLGEKVVI